MNTRQSAELDECRIFKKIQKLAEEWENNWSVLFAPEISINAPIKIENESKEAF